MKKLLCLIASLMIALGCLGLQDDMATVHALTAEDEAYIAEAKAALQEIVQEREILGMVYLVTDYPIRQEPAYDSEAVMKVASGQSVLINDIHVEMLQNEAGELVSFDVWEYVSFYYGEQLYSGYIPRCYLATADERFLAWEEEYGMNPAAYAYLYEEEGMVTATNANADIEAFPESYRSALYELREQHPNWIFVAMNTGLDWQTVINNELGSKSLVYKTLPEWTREGLYDDGQWYYASEAGLKHYMDPRNHLTESSIFQFEQLTYNESYHTEEALETFLSHTFMAGTENAPGTDMTFAKIFWAIGARDKVSPFHLAARVYQEQGNGTSPLISGTYPGYEGYYNYFNVGATGTTDTEEIVTGLTYAKNKGWTNAYYSIEGGASTISGNYILRGQDTTYLQKFNVNPSGYYALYTHQYMQNITAPKTESASMKKLYAGTGALDSAFVFKIPVFENMPATPCGEPTTITLNIPAGYTDTTVYLDGMGYAATVNNGKYVVTAPDKNAKTAVVYQYDSTGAPIGMYVWTLQFTNGAYVATEQPAMQDLLINHGFSIRIAGQSGLRCKTSIAQSVRNSLTSTGINGLTLKEYGTVIMTMDDAKVYPMLKDATKAVTGMAYGTQSNGSKVDSIFETVNNRYRYTAVLVNIPAAKYKTEYAFRGYVTLLNGTEEITLYGPIVSQSIYNVAKQLLNSGAYTSGSATEYFLQKIIADADAS